MTTLVLLSDLVFESNDKLIRKYYAYSTVNSLPSDIFLRVPIRSGNILNTPDVIIIN